MTGSEGVVDVLLGRAGDLGAGALVTIFILLVFFGRLVNPKEIREERDYWRAMALELKDQNTKLIEAAETTVKLVRALPGAEKIE